MNAMTSWKIMISFHPSSLTRYLGFYKNPSALTECNSWNQVLLIQWPWALDTRDLKHQCLECEKADCEVTLTLTPQKSQILGFLRQQYPTVKAILTNSSRQFGFVMHDWAEALKGRSRHGSAFGLSYGFFRAHAQCLDAIDLYIIKNLCAQELTLLLKGSILTYSPLETTDLIFGPGCAILAYNALGVYLGMTGKQACNLQDSHRISNQDILLPPIQTLPGPHLPPWPMTSLPGKPSLLGSSADTSPKPPSSPVHVPTPSLILSPLVSCHSVQPVPKSSAQLATSLTYTPTTSISSLPKLCFYRDKGEWHAAPIPVVSGSSTPSTEEVSVAQTQVSVQEMSDSEHSDSIRSPRLKCSAWSEINEDRHPKI
ncbi:hypothetical protein K439DRAFT_1612644 [Ramaria rubella]|nr:hypothetical protein K439DRAFT_1612644 [Ramaria rubella]